MTNEEFAKMKAADTQFLEAFYKMYAHFYVKLKDETFTTFRSTPLGDYLWRIQHVISEIDQNLEDIKFAEEMLHAYDPNNKPLSKKGNAAHAIRYHYENYILRATKIKDHSLSLINEVMRLQVRKSPNMENQLIKRLDPVYGEFSLFWGYMKQLTDHIKPYRNYLAHNGTVQHEDLSLLNAHYTIDITHKNPADQFRFDAGMTGVQRELVNKFTHQINVHLINSDQVLKMIYLYLAKPFFNHMEQLTTEYKQRRSGKPD
jgi:hypothetical protein